MVLPPPPQGSPQPLGPRALGGQQPLGALLQLCAIAEASPASVSPWVTRCVGHRLPIKGNSRTWSLPSARVSSLVLVRGEAEMCWLLPLTLFVSRQHPHFDVAQFQQLDGFRDSILQLVLNGCGPEQLE